MTQSPVAPPQAEEPHPGRPPATQRAASRRASAETVGPRASRLGRTPAGAGTRHRIAAYVALTKPRIIELLLVTTVPTMLLAARGLPSWWLVVATVVGGTLAAGSANALNCYVDRDIDARMRRTGHRPLARHDVSPTAALVFGLALGVVAVALMSLTTNLLAGALTLVAIAFYVVVYTMVLKRRTAQNIVWGGAAGCMPVLIGWAAVTGSLSWAPVVLFAVVFFWTPPHFWSLAIRYREDYDRAGVPMLPVVASPVTVANRIVVYSWLTVAASLALWPLATGWVYGVLALLAGVVLLREAHLLLRATRRAASDPARTVSPMRLFHTSNSYLAFLFVAVAIDAFLH